MTDDALVFCGKRGKEKNEKKEEKRRKIKRMPFINTCAKEGRERGKQKLEHEGKKNARTTASQKHIQNGWIAETSAQDTPSSFPLLFSFTDHKL